MIEPGKLKKLLWVLKSKGFIRGAAIKSAANPLLPEGGQAEA